MAMEAVNLVKEPLELVDIRKPYFEIVRDNAQFLKFYKLQNFVEDENEWQEFLQALRTDLPTCFRVTGFKDEAKALMHVIETEMFAEYGRGVASINNIPVNEVQMPQSLPWYPDGLAYQLLLTRRDIRRSEPLYRLHNFLIDETKVGAISRQECVSMIPPILLDVKPTDKVIDLCAAPGSKTAQIIEALHAEPDKYDIPPGFVIANDVDNNRCYMLIHQAKRLNSPCCMVTNADACNFPNLVYTKSDGTYDLLKFDKILCDVPCSGDGTLRKNPDIWGKWKLAQSYGLHGIQYRILLRGIQMLADGGRLVYSTCSLNPVENEAVVQRILTDAEGSVRLIDVSNLVPGLKYKPGMKTWQITSRNVDEVYKSFDEVPTSQQTTVRPHMFPLPEDEINKLGLEKCLRILPHFQNTGGFFVAVFEKTTALPSDLAKDSKDELKAALLAVQNKTSSSNGGNEGKPFGHKSKRRRFHGYKEDPYVFLNAADKDWLQIKEFYGMNDKFNGSCLLTRRKSERKRNVYFASDLVKDLLVLNEHRIKIVNMGLKIFVRCENALSANTFRLTQEAVYTTVRFMDDRRHIKVTRDDLITLMKCRDPTRPPLYSEFDKATEEACLKIGVGSCVIIYRDERFLLYVVGWRGSAGLRAYVDVNESMHIMRLLGVDLTEFEINKYQKAREEALKLEQTSQNDQEEVPSKTDDEMDMLKDSCPVPIKDSTNATSSEEHSKDQEVGDA